MKRASTGGKRSGDHKRLRNEAECDLPDVAELEDDLTQIQHQSTAQAPASTDDGTLSLVQTMTAEEINKHVYKCLEMNSENKITPKNAFALQLIDCLKYLVDKKKDFSTMAYSLDAGAKIYSYRVDALHQKVITLAEEVMLNLRKNQTAVEEENEGPNRSVRRFSRKGILTANETIVRKLKIGDPKDKYLKVTALPGAIISGVRLDQKDFSFTLENNIPFWADYTNYKPTRAEGSGILPKIEVVRDSSRIVCFETNKLLQDHVLHCQESESRRENTFSETVCDSQNHPAETPLSETDHDAEYIPEDTPLSPASNNNDPDEVDINYQEDTCNKEGDEVEVLATAMKRLNKEAEDGMCPPPTRAEAIKMLFDGKSEYHYLDMNNVKYWAGPDYWTRSQQGPPSDENKKRKRGRKPKLPGLIDYDVKIPYVDWDNGLRYQSNLSSKKVESWKPSSTTMPTDLKYDLDTFTDLFHMTLKELENNQNDRAETDQSDPQCSVEFVDIENRMSSIPEEEDEHNPLNSQDGDVYDENSKSPRDEADFGDYSCDITSYNIDINGRGRLIKINVDSDNIPGYDDASLVPAPKMVTVKPIQFKSRPIRVNMRHLKEVMLDQIKKDFENDRRQQTTFSKLFREIPPRLEKTTAKDLTPSLAFLALLTLANENSFHITSFEHNQDAIVTLMKDENYNRIEETNKVDRHIINMVNDLS